MTNDPADGPARFHNISYANDGRGEAPLPSREIDVLLRIMAALRHPETGCSWDLEQTFETIAPYAVEEAHEVADAVARGDPEDIRDELGDLLLQVVFQARIAQERALFDFGGVVEAITAKLIRRHPHVFGDARDLSAEQVKRLWDEIKRTEKAEAARRRGLTEVPPASVLDGVSASLPPTTRALKLTRKAASVGFTWSDPRAVVAKLREELDEADAAIAGGDRAGIADEIGDLLFTAINLARELDIDPDAALAGANRKFDRRFRYVEAGLAEEGRRPAEAELAEMDRLWDAAKAEGL